jgi:exo-1,4-beta-D-glucosaminidase
MNNGVFWWILNALLIFCLSCSRPIDTTDKLYLRENWNIQSSAEIKEGGENISIQNYNTENWYSANVPSTVLGTLVENKVYPDPYYGTNIEKIPGYITGRRREMPEDSPFRISWWYRTTFNLPGDYKKKSIWLHIPSINYQANIWLNGNLIADTTEIEGAYRLYNLNITDYSIAGDKNCLAMEIFPPQGQDLTITWVDWNPTPPDRGMGIWYDIFVNATGPVSIENPQIITDLDVTSLDEADLTISAELKNAEKKEVSGIFKGKIEDIEFSSEVKLGPGETKTVKFSPEKFPQLKISKPRLWWPYNVGPQNMYDLNLIYEISGRISDSKKERFGIRKITSIMNTFDDKKTRVFQVNGKNIVIRGGGYVEDMMLRPDRKKVEAEIQYAKHMNLNALRMEAPRGSDYIFDLCDENGIMLIVGWCCCSSWERWNSWTPHIADIAEKSLKDQVLRLRNHPSVIDWLYGSDGPPPAVYEKRYIQVLDQYDGTRPYQSSATQDSSDIAGYTGLWMGPFPSVYSYQLPSYWYGKFQFNTEAGPSGEQISPVESMRKMMPEEDLWPISDSWNIRLHRRFYPDARTGLYSRYGEPGDLEEYSIKSQVFQKEATRALFEAFARNKYRSSGIIYWMYNSAWPTLFWQLFDYFLTPNGAFYGTKKACESLHIQYSYDDSTIYVVNGYYEDFSDLQASVKVYNDNMEVIYSNKLNVYVLADESKKILKIDSLQDINNIYFLKLELKDTSGKLISNNFYWLSVKGDEKADFTALNNLEETSLNISVGSVKRTGTQYTVTVDFENPSSSLAYAINPKIKRNLSKDLLTPVFWEDNYFSLLPNEKVSLKVDFNAEDLKGEKPILEVEGWNLKPVIKQIE